METLIHEMTAIEAQTRELLKKKNLSIRAFCKAVGINSNTLYDIFAQGYGKIPTLKKMADVLGVTYTELMNENEPEAYQLIASTNEENPTARYVSPYREKLVEVRYVSRKAVASFIETMDGGCDKEWNEETFSVFVDGDLNLTDRNMVFEVTGDSMEPTLNDGSRILTERIGKPFDSIESGVYVILYRRNLVIKRIIGNDILTQGILVLHADNPRHGAMPVRSDDLRCAWRVMEVVRQKVK